jgi:hypothetical protein
VFLENLSKFQQVNVYVRIGSMGGEFDNVTPVAKRVVLVKLQAAAEE